MRKLGYRSNPTRQREHGMNNKERIEALEQKVFELEALLGLLESSIHSLLVSEGMSVKPLDSGKWYKKYI